jgi:hypothetical protein
MLCKTCLGVLQQGQNTLKSHSYYASLSEEEASTDSDQESVEYENTSEKELGETGLRAITSENAPVEHFSTSSSVTTKGGQINGEMRSDASSTPETQQDSRYHQVTNSQSKPGCDEPRSECRMRQRRQTKHGHHQDFSELQASITSGCQICWQTWEHLSEDEQRILGTANGSKTNKIGKLNSARYLTYAVVQSYSNDDSDGNYGLSIHFKNQKSYQWASSFHLYLESGSYAHSATDTIDTNRHVDELAKLPTKHITSSCTSSQESLSTAKQWLHDCISSHAPCTQEMSTVQWYPTRLLYLGEVGQEVDSVQLIHTREHKLVGPYTTLSHRWGGASFVQLTRHNLERFSHAISIAEMPKTFCDAIVVSKSLQVRYLWIDSLCIKQDKDDRSDWEFEASQMHEVYSRSYCNISASQAGDSSDGLFRTRNPRLLPDTKVDLCLNNRCKLAKAHRPYIVSNNSLFYKNVSNCALNKRGWVFQERMLAPRVLHFCRDQLFWECRKHVACEQYAFGVPSVFYYNLPATTLKANKAYLQRDNTSWYKLWDDFVMAYTQTSLTYPDDKLIALSGVVKMVRSMVHDVYVAGMWRKNLAQQLLWACAGPATRPSVYRAPSWSWAAVEGHIRTASYGKTSQNPEVLAIEVEDVHLNYVADDDTGQIRDGWLDLTGDLKPVYLVWNESEQEDPQQTWFMALDDDPDLIEYFTITIGNTQILDLDDSFVEKEVIIQRSAAAQYFCMPANRPSGDWQKDVEEDRNEFLLLCLVDAEKLHFERVGMGDVIDPDYLEMLHENLDEDFKRSLPCLRYENGKHTIRII